MKSILHPAPEKQAEVVDQLDTKVELIQALLPLGLLRVQELLEEEVRQLAGARHSRKRGAAAHVRWGGQSGSVWLLDQKVRVRVPRVRHRQLQREVPLESYHRLQRPRQQDEMLFQRVLRGLSCRDYKSCAELVPSVFGLSPSSVSRRYVQVTARKLRQLCERRLEGLDVVVLFLDGKTFAQDELIIALGVTLSGQKVVLGFIQSATENERVVTEFLQELVERGLEVGAGVLCVIDGAKGLRSALTKVFGKEVTVHRCQWHKRENVVSYLPKFQQAVYRRKLQQAYERPDYAQAKEALRRVRSELAILNESAARSLDEGFEETLTLHRLGLFKELGISLKTTNCLESLLAQVGQQTDKVDYWRNNNQKQRWVASALLELEPRLRKIKGYRYLPQLRTALISRKGVIPLAAA